MTYEIRDTGALLVACLAANGAPISDERLRTFPPRAWDRVATAARGHGIAPAVHVALRESDVVPGLVHRALSDDHRLDTQRHLLTCAVLTELVAAFDACGIRYVGFKGPVLAETVYPRPDLRSYLDLDLLVHPEDFQAAFEMLEAQRGALLEANWEVSLHLLRGELNLMLPIGVPVDLHWSLFVDAARRARFDFDTADVLDNAERREVAGTSVAVLSPVDQLLHLCAHACLNGDHRLGWMQDVRMAATRLPIVWPEFWSRAQDTGLEVVACVVLDRVRRCFGAEFSFPPTEHAIAGWSALLAAFDRLRPPWGSQRGPLSGRFLYAGTRATANASVRGAFEELGSSLRQLRTNREHPWRQAVGRFRTTDSVPDLFVADGDWARAAFFEAVRAGSES